MLDVLQMRMKEAIPRHAIVVTENKIHCELCLANGKRLLKPCPSPQAIKSLNMPYDEAKHLVDYIASIGRIMALQKTAIEEAKVFAEYVIDALETKIG